MAGLLDLFGSGGDSDLYNGALTDPQQRAMVGQGLLAMGAAIAKASAPSRLPASPFGAFAEGAGAFGQAEQEAARNAMQGTLLGYQGQLMRQRLGAMNDFSQTLPGLLAAMQGGGAAPAAAGPSGVAGAATPPPGAASGLLAAGGLPGGPGASAAAPEAGAPASPVAGRPTSLPNGAWPFPGPPVAPTRSDQPPTLPADVGPGGPAGRGAGVAPPPGLPAPVTAPAGPPLAQGGAIDPRALLLAAAGSRAQMAGLGDVMKPFETALYGSPAYKGKVAGAEAGAKAGAELPFAGPTAYAKAAGEGAGGLPYKITTVRPGSTALQGTQPIYTAPTQVQAVDAEGNARPAFIAPPGSPSPYAASGGQGPMTKLGPGVTTGLEARAKAEQESRQATIEQGGAAQAQQATLTKMRDDAANFYTGPFAEHVQEAKTFLRLIPGASEDVVNSVAKYEDFTKNAGQLIRQAVKEQSPRAAVQEFKLITSQLPNPEMSPVGLRMVTNELMGLNDYRIAKAQAQNLYEQRPGSHGPGDVTNFETMWQANVSPYAFMVQRMEPGERQALVAKLNQSAEGRGEIAHLYQQMQFITKTGLHNFLQ